MGNGPSAIDSKNGSYIDDFPCVVRFNNFKTEGFEDKIGKKTDLHAVNEGWVYGGIKKRDITTLIAVPYTKHTRPGLWSDLNNRVQGILGVYMVREGIAQNSTRKGDKWLSTGLITIFELLCSMDHLWLTGFDCFQNRDGHHYFDEEPCKGNHNSDMELSAICRLEKLGHVTFL